jgi:hypothetical protein
MKITHDDLKRAYKSHIQRRIPPSREACPSAEFIFSVFDKAVSPADKDRIIDHITGCCYCLQEFELFLDFHRQEEKAIGDIVGCLQSQRIGSAAPGKEARMSGVLSSSNIKVRPLWRWVTASLVVVGIMVLSIIGIRSFLKTPQDAERGRLPAQIRLISPVRGEKIKMPLVFRWEGTARAEYYLLEIFDNSLLPLWKSPPVKGLQYELPSEAVDIIKKNDACFWTITAWLIDGTKRESLLEEFAIKE